MVSEVFLLDFDYDSVQRTIATEKLASYEVAQRELLLGDVATVSYRWYRGSFAKLLQLHASLQGVSSIKDRVWVINYAVFR